MIPCAECGKPIVRRFVGSIEAWGHEANPAAAHHYARPARLTTKPRPWAPTFDERFWQRVEKTDTCWNWTGAKYPDGYGDIRRSGTGHKMAHRYSYATLVGPIPDDLPLDHLCRNHACVNPAHLEPVTTRENILRGTAPSAVNARKTHCPQGHELVDDNLVALTRGGRTCKTCHRDQMRSRGASRAEYMRRWRKARPAPRPASETTVPLPSAHVSERADPAADALGLPPRPGRGRGRRTQPQVNAGAP